MIQTIFQLATRQLFASPCHCAGRCMVETEPPSQSVHVRVRPQMSNKHLQSPEVMSHHYRTLGEEEKNSGWPRWVTVVAVIATATIAATIAWFLAFFNSSECFRAYDCQYVRYVTKNYYQNQAIGYDPSKPFVVPSAYQVFFSSFFFFFFICQSCCDLGTPPISHPVFEFHRAFAGAL